MDCDSALHAIAAFMCVAASHPGCTCVPEQASGLYASRVEPSDQSVKHVIAAGARERRGSSLDGGAKQGSRAIQAARAALAGQRAPIMTSPFSNPFSSGGSGRFQEQQQQQQLRPTGQSSARLKAEITSSLSKYKSSPCTFDREGRGSPMHEVLPLYSVPHP